MRFQLFVLFVALAFAVQPALAQVDPPPQQPEPQQEMAPMQQPAPQGPETYTITSLEVEGTGDESTASFVARTSGLQVGQEIVLPGDEALGEAIRSIYEVGLFSDVKIKRDRQEGNEVALTIEVVSEPVLANYRFQGVTNRQREALREEISLLSGRPARPGDIQRSERAIRDYFEGEGYFGTSVRSHKRQLEDDRVEVIFYVDQGERSVIRNIRFEGNENISDRRLRGQLDENKERRWWRFWSRESLDRNALEQDLQNVIDYYNEQGFYDAQILSDSVYLAEDGINIEVRLREGNRYHVRNIRWEGNTVFPDRALTEALGMSDGDVFNSKQLERNLLGNEQSTDVSAMYRNQGYMMVNVDPRTRVVQGDSVEVVIDVREGEIFEIGQIDIAGNTKTKDHVIRRELYTLPGHRFSQEAIQESIRRLMQLDYFSQESLAQGPGISVDEDRNEVDLRYEVEEVGSDQLELSGTWGQLGLVLQLSFNFNNFSIQNIFDPSAYRPLPSGDGQSLSMSVQTNGRFYQSYSLSFTEPWFRSTPTPVGGSVSYTRFSDIGGRGFLRGGMRQQPDQQPRTEGLFEQFNSRLFLQRRLSWPDDRFQTSNSVGYRYYNIQGDFGGTTLGRNLPRGVSQQIVLEQGISRNSLDNPMFPTRGSRTRLNLELSPPIGDFLQYHKWRFNTSWNLPIADRVSFNTEANYGYIGTLTGDPVQFQRFEMGGTAFDYQQATYGSDPVFMRGYPRAAIGPRETINGSLVNVGGRIMNKYSTELRWTAVQSQQLRAAPYIFFDAGNTYRDFDSFDPATLYRSAGIGARLFLPIVGMIEVSYGYNFDRFPEPGGRGGLAPRDWTFQFSLGQGGR